MLDFRKIIDLALAALPSDRSAYFVGIAQTISEDRRYETDARLMFVVLAACVADLPDQLEKEELLLRLHAFTRREARRLQAEMIKPTFIYTGGRSVDRIAQKFSGEILQLVFDRLQSGEIETDGQDSRLFQFQWPHFNDPSFPYRDEDD